MTRSINAATDTVLLYFSCRLCQAAVVLLGKKGMETRETMTDGG